MYEQASVISIHNSKVVKVTCETAGCANCHASSFCNTKGKSFLAHNHSGSQLNIGDVVELYLPPGKTIFAGFITLLVPIILFPIGYYLPSWLHFSESEVVSVLLGLAAIGVGFLISRLFSKIKGHDYIPQITRILEQK